MEDSLPADASNDEPDDEDEEKIEDGTNNDEEGNAASKPTEIDDDGNQVDPNTDQPDSNADPIPPDPQVDALAPPVVEHEVKVEATAEISTEAKFELPDSKMTLVSTEEDAEDKEGQEHVVYEWEEELEEYDLPDVYPSEKDYKWVTELVEILPEEEEEKVVAAADIALLDSEGKTTQELEQEQRKTSVGSETAQEKQATTTDVPGTDLEKPVSEIASETGEVASVLGTGVEQEAEEEVPKKKFKTVQVKKLVERPPKIHYEPQEERRTHLTDHPQAFHRPPFSLLHSFGYDAQRMANLQVLDQVTLVYMSGFVLTFFNHQTLEKTYLRCLGGGSFGALAIHPSRRLFAAAEKGNNPLIGIWSWPKLQLFRKLSEGTNKVYASINFSPDGRLLASQGGEPDYLITVWNWLAEFPLLRVKSHAQDVYRVTFSRELAGRLTTSGLCHIKFWKMAYTFTGLKLKGDIGRFGRTELSDIEGYVEMPDGKVLSGSEWGNLLVWENGLIVAELCIKPDLPCHDGIVRQVLLTEGEFYTAGQDGMVKTWSFDAVDTAEINTTEASLKVPIKVLAKVHVGEGADLWSIVQDVFDTSSNSVFWFAQDGKGTIWKVDLSFLNTAKEPVVVSTAHGGAIVACACSSVYYLFATLGVDGQLRVYNYRTRTLVARVIYGCPGSCLIWPLTVDPTGATLIAGFADGTFRVMVLSGNDKEDLPLTVNLEQVRKPHSRRLVCLEVDSDGQFLVTGGEDGNLFFFDVKQDYRPMCFVQMPDWKAVRILCWARNPVDRKSVFAALDGGTIQEVLAPTWEEIDNETSYFHLSAKLLRRYDFLSIKSELRHNEELQRERIAEEARQAALEEENRQRITDGLETQSQQDLRLLQEAEEMEKIKSEEKPKEKWEPFIPTESSPIILMIPSPFQNNELILSMGKYDAGYLYTVKMVESEDNPNIQGRPKEPISAISVVDSDDVPVTAYTMSVDGDHVYWGFEDGRVRVQKMNYGFDLENVGPHWTEGIHDCVRGSLTSVVLDKDNLFLITCGNDGNCFLHTLASSDLVETQFSTFPNFLPQFRPARTDIQDILSPNDYTLEVSKTIEKEQALLLAARRNKAAKREEIVRLRLMYYEIVRRNNELPEHCRLSETELMILKDGPARRETDMKQALDQLYLEQAWETERCTIALNKLQSFYIDCVDCNFFVVKAFHFPLTVSSFRLPAFPPFFQLAKDKILHQTTPRGVESSIGDEDMSRPSSLIYESETKPKRKRGMDKFVYQKLVRLWERKQKKIQRHRVWKEFLATEPKGRELREEDKAIEEATNTIGDMKLKMSADYKVPDKKKLTEHRARKRLVFLEEIMYTLKNDFNKKLLEQRERKIALIEQMTRYRDIILEHQELIPVTSRLEIPVIEQMSPEENWQSLLDYTPDQVKAYKQQLDDRARVEASQVTAPKPKRAETPVKRKHHGGQLYRKVSSTGKIQTVETFNRDEEKPKDDGNDLGNFVDTIPCEPSALENHIDAVKLVQAKHYEGFYVDKMNEEMFIFNAQVKLLRHRKTKLDFLLKTADQRMVILTQEFMLAQRSEAMEAAMEAKIIEANHDRRDYQAQIKTLSKKQEFIKKDMDGFARQKNVLLQEVTQIASKVPTFEKYLIRVFNKKMSKPKTKDPELQGSESFASSGSDDNSDSSSDLDLDLDEDEDDGFDIDFPPPELNKDIYQQVVDIRSGRLTIDEHEQAAREVYDDLANSINLLKNKTAAADREFERGRKELEAFSKEKQRFLNEIDVAVSLNLHQLRHLEADLSQTLVTENGTISRLRQRIPELLREKRLQRKRVLEVKKMHSTLVREKQKFLERLEEMNKSCDLEMLKKFGLVTDIEVLENFCIDPEIINLQKQLNKTEEQFAKELSVLQHEQDQVVERRLKSTRAQTTRFFTMSELVKQIIHMTQIMDEDMKRLPSEYEDDSIKLEARQLRELVSHQWMILSSLNQEILSLTRRQPLPPIQAKCDQKKD